ncbi:demethoxyubiquinone hydroxylase family protein [Belnapia sp. T18]|uniref:Demethoxyubiquinone hydroxylase family protein n=1 Tax=Belnapia arida TaxID=2804533 RepID=A0ABS1U5F4_9PROT|nr:demethoxyubiquinone hydroxylase family protein [Belnapia arida]MBL6079902.1 demethoxyubiquinone hydroxylase family protein [Belnapia arida]
MDLPAPTLDDAAVTRLATSHPLLVGDLRSDHAGETGAVMIYRGILACSRDPAVRAFASRHLETEAGHLRLLEAMLPPAQRSRLLPIWRVAGWLTGALPALVGPAAVQVTIEAVETFVDHHYREQIERLPAAGEAGALRALLEQCRLEEVEHRDEAAELLGAGRGWLARLWGGLVGRGSAAAVAAARRI